MAPERSEGATKDVLVPVAAAVTKKHSENVAVISNNNRSLYLMAMVANVMPGYATCFILP